MTRGTAGADADADADAAEEPDAAAGGEEVAAAAAVELDEQPATARTDRATAPETPASRRTRVRWNVLFIESSLWSRHIAGVPRS
jgi:hypothetical protein